MAQDGLHVMCIRNVRDSLHTLGGILKADMRGVTFCIEWHTYNEASPNEKNGRMCTSFQVHEIEFRLGPLWERIQRYIRRLRSCDK